jgi:hypothetical protein
MYKIKRAGTGSAPLPPPWSYTPSGINVLVLAIMGMGYYMKNGFGSELFSTKLASLK